MGEWRSRVAALLFVAACSPLSEGEFEAGTDGATESTSGSPSTSPTEPNPSTTVASESSATTTDPTEDPTSGDPSSTSSPDTEPTTDPSTTRVDTESDSTSDDDSDENTSRVETDDDSDESGEPPEERRVFLSSATYTGDLGGALGADDKCQDLADAASLGGTWRAYIIDSDNGLDRHTQDTRPLVLLDGTVVADNWDDLTDGSIDSNIDLDENEEARSGNAWTGFYDVLAPDDTSCTDWTFEGGNCLSIEVCGSAGESNMTDTHWDGFYIFNCSDEYRLYCLEQ